MIITSTHYNRPDCTKQMIEYLSNCIGVEKCHVLFFVEPGCKEVSEEIEKCSLNKTVIHNTRLLGLWPNKRQAIDAGFKYGDFVLHLEDDVLLGKDALLYFDWAKETFKNDKEIFDISAFNTLPKEEYDGYCKHRYMRNKAGKRNHYCAYAWATWLDRYQELNKVQWTGQDTDLMNKIHKAQGLKEVFPYLSRCQNIGHVNGIKSKADDVIKAAKKFKLGPYAVAGISHKSDEENIVFTNRELYITALEIKVKQYPEDKTAAEQLRKAKENPLEEQLIVNSAGEEIVKLDDNTVKSRNREEYKQHYFLPFWSENFVETEQFELL